jgi:HNH endonuclease
VANAIDRFWKYVVKPNDSCWFWVGGLTHNGYGQFNNGKTTVRAHRWIYGQERGPVPVGIMVLHSCDNRNCVRIDHLFLGTAGENTADMIRKERKKFDSVLTESDVWEIRARLAEGDMHKDIAEDYGVSRATITDINTEKRWGWT